MYTVHLHGEKDKRGSALSIVFRNVRNITHHSISFGQLRLYPVIAFLATYPFFSTSNTSYIFKKSSAHLKQSRDRHLSLIRTPVCTGGCTARELHVEAYAVVLAWDEHDRAVLTVDRTLHADVGEVGLWDGVDYAPDEF